MFKKILVMLVVAMFGFGELAAQEILEAGKLSGNFQMDAQLYNKDDIIEAPEVGEKILSNGFLNLNYTNNKISAGLRYENFANPMLGYDPRYKGSGIPYRFARYSGDVIDVTVGNYYEQFGSGMILRTYWDPALGYDNSLDGIRAKLRPTEGLEITTLIGKQRMYWSQAKGIVRGADMNISVNDLLGDILGDEYRLDLGASVVSKFQEDTDSKLVLPENVLAYSGRAALSGSDFSLDAEYSYKYNDPNATNDYNYNPGTGLLINAAYFPEGIGISVSFHRVDNMDFRSDRAKHEMDANINFLPTLTKQQSYRLATAYPFATQPNGEIGFQAEVNYLVPKKSMLGGKYGMNLTANFSQVNSINKTPDYIDPDNGRVYTYNTNFFELGEELYYREFNLEVQKKWGKKFKSTFTGIHSTYNKDVVQEEGHHIFGMVNSTILIADLTWKIARRKALRLELQHMWSKNDSTVLTPDNINGNWMYALAEFTIAPAWYISVWNEYNYGNEYEERQLHYPNASVAWIHHTTRVACTYGRQRGGIICVGGVCRPVPASNGFALSVSSSF
ncbi:MAG: DUF6029 family protein [Candidatus Kapabacteria bacterium]|nr:DUF6029 family protein [Candidatus Kapabacteria bacterium]